jgi:hypothetical protein
MLKGCKVVIWHTAGDTNIREILEKKKIMEPMVVGGCAAVTRAMILALPMGYRTIHLYGVDSSFYNGDTHIRKSTTVERAIPIMCNGRVFETAPWMTQQAEDFKVLAKGYSEQHGIKFIVHGDGLIPHIAATMNFDVDLPVKIRKKWIGIKRNATILWQHV